VNSGQKLATSAIPPAAPTSSWEYQALGHGGESQRKSAEHPGAVAREVACSSGEESAQSAGQEAAATAVMKSRSLSGRAVIA
jgi:hypothetical protein